MATYLILSSKKPKMEGHTITLRSSASIHPKSCSSSLSPKVQPKVSALPVKGNKVKPTWLHEAENQQPTQEPASPPLRLESRTPTPSPSPQRGPGAFFSTHSTHNRIDLLIFYCPRAWCLDFSSLSTFIPLVISFSFMALNNIYMPMTPKFVFPVLTSPLNSRLIYLDV